MSSHEEPSEPSEIIEIDAIAVEEWEHDQHTPMANDTNLAALVKQSATASSGPVKALDEGWDDAPAAQLAKPRTTTNTLRRTGTAAAVSAVHPPKTKTMAFPTALVKPAMPQTNTSNSAPAKRAETHNPISRPTMAASVPKSFAPRPPSDGGASLAAGTKKPELAPIVARPAMANRPASEPAGTKPPLTTRPPLEAAKRPATQPAPPATPPKRPTTEASPTLAAPTPVTPAAPAVSKRPTSELTAKAKRATSDPAVAIPAPAKPAAAEAGIAAVPASPFEATLSSSDADWLPAWPPATAGTAAPAPTVEPADDLAVPMAPATLAPRAALAPQAPQASQAPFEDWDDPSQSTAIGNQVAPTEAKRNTNGNDDASMFPRESSVIIDLNAAPKTPVTPKRPQSQPVPVMTSELSTTTSGVFVMPTAAAPQARQSTPGAAVPNVGSSATAQMLDPVVRDATPARRDAPERPSSPWQTPLPGPLPGEPPAAAAVSPFSRTAAERALDYATPTSASSARTFVPTPGPIEPAAAPLAPAPAPVWPSAAGLGYDMANDAVVPAPITRHEPTEPAQLRTPLLTPKRRRVALIAIAGAFVAILVIAMASGGKQPVTTAETTPVAAKTPTTAPAPVDPTPVPASPTATPTPSSTPVTRPAAAVAVAAITPTTNPTTRPPAKSYPAKRHLKAKKPVVVDYDKKPVSSPDVDQSLAKARSLYANGNQRLFAGDTAGAISEYRQALAAYPSYAASYRGIGLAYAQQGNKPSALDAFKTYVKLAPTAKDIALIKKRIANLSIH